MADISNMKGATLNYMENRDINIRVESAFSDDHTHRYYLKKVWDDSRPIPLVISKSAGFDNGITETTTMTIITNNLYDNGYGGFCLCNLFSKINGTESDEENIETIKALLKDKSYKEIIVCWGNLSASKLTVQEQGQLINTLLAGVKRKNIIAVSDGTLFNCHPLSPSVRKHFELVSYDIPSANMFDKEDDIS